MTSQGWFNFGHEKSRFKAFEGFMSNGDYYVFGKIYGGETAGYITLRFNDTGFQDSKFISNSDVRDKVVGNKELVRQSMTSGNFDVSDIDKIDANRRMLICQSYETVSEMIPAAAGQSMGTTVYHKVYNANMFLVFDENAQLINHFSIGKTNAAKRK